MKILKILIKAFLAFTLLILIFWAAGGLFLQTEKGQNWVMNKIIQLIESETDAEVQIKRIEFVLPLRLRIHQLTIKTDHTLLFSANKLDLNCLSPKLLEGRIVCSKIYAQDVEIGNHPLFSPNPDSNGTFSISEKPLPIYLKIEKLQIENLHIDPNLIDKFIQETSLKDLVKSSTFDIQGSLKNNPIEKSIVSHLIITAKGRSESDPTLQLALDLHSHQLALSAHVNHLPTNLLFISSLGESYTNITWHTSASIPVWNAFFGNRLEKPIEGSLNANLFTFENEGMPFELFGDYASFNCKYQLISKNQFNVYEAKLNTPFMKLQGTIKGSFDSLIEMGTFKWEIEDTSPLARAFASPFSIQGPMTLQGTLEGSWNSPSIKLQLLAPNLKIGDHNYSKINSSIIAKIANRTVEGSTQISLEHQDNPYFINSDFILKPNQLQLNQLAFSGLSSHIKGQGSVSLPDYICTGDLELVFEDLNKVTAFFNSTPVQGAAQIHINLKPGNTKSNQHTQFIQCQINAQNMQSLDWKARDISASAIFDDAWKNLSDSFEIQNQIQLTDLQNSDFNIQTLTINTTHQIDLSKDRPKRAAPFTISGKGSFKEDVDFTLSGTWLPTQNSFEVHVDRLNGHLGPYPLTNSSPFAFDYLPENEMHLKGLIFKLGEGEFETDVTLKDQQINCHVKGTKIPSELLHFVAPEAPISGRISFDMLLNGPVENPQGTFTLQLHHIQIIEEMFAAKPFLNGKIDAAINDNGISFEGALNGFGKTPITTKGIIPLEMSLYPFKLKSNEKNPFNLSLNADGDLDPYLHLFYNDSTNLTGRVKIALTLSGHMQSPQINGEVELFNGSFESFNTGAIYKNIQARLEGDGSKLILKSFSAQDIKHGSITASGSLSLDSALDYPFEFKIQPSQIFIMDSDYATFSASGALTLIGDQQQGKLQGTLTVDRATIRMEEALPTQIKTVDVIYINIPEGESLSYLQAHEVTWPLHLDVKVIMPDNVLIQGKNLNSEWKGTVDVTGTPTSPLFNGELRVLHGDYNFNGKKFALTQGNIHFAGPADKKTTLYVVASKEINKIRAEIIVKGPTSKLGVSFRSNPPLSQREVMSYILFNRGISDITSDQGNQLTQSFVELNSSDPAQTDMLTRLRNNIGIDRLDLTSSDTENKELSLQVGKYITDGILVSINKSINAAANRVAIEAKLMKNVQAQAEVGDDSQGKIMLKWKKDY